MVLDLTCDDLHRPAAYRFCSHDCEYKGTTFFVRFQILPLDLGRFSAQNR